MAERSLANSEHRGHLWGDVLALFPVAAVLALLTPRGAERKPTKSGLMAEVGAGQWTYWKRNEKRISESSDLVRKL
jgi:hypothetical protein